MLGSGNPLLLGSRGYKELAEGALDGTVAGCQAQTFSRWASSATCSRVSLPPSFRSLLLRGAPDGEHRPHGMKVTRFSMRLLPSRCTPLCQADRTSGGGRSQNGLRAPIWPGS
jgi:hypothetical protein